MTDHPSALVTVPRADLERVRDLLMERIYGSNARSPGHNARLEVEAMLAAAPAAPQAAGVGERVRAACAVFQEAIDYFEADVADVMSEGSERADLWDREVTVNIDALKAVMNAALRAPSREPEGGAVLDERGVYLRDNLDVVLRAVEDMARLGIEVAKQKGENYQTEGRDRARIEFVAEVCRRWSALATREEAPAEAGEPKYFAAFMAEDGALRAQPQAREDAQPTRPAPDALRVLDTERMLSCLNDLRPSDNKNSKSTTAYNYLLSVIRLAALQAEQKGGAA